MAASIIHRATGVALAFAGLAMLTWWLVATGSGPDSYATFTNFVAWLSGAGFARAHGAGVIMTAIGLLIGVGLTWAFFQHLLSGIRHLIMDSGAAFELGINKTSAILTFVGAAVLTAALWAWLLGLAK